MDAFAYHGNETVTLNHINAILSLVSLMSTQFLVNSFTVISDGDMSSALTFLKSASKFNLQMSYKNSTENNSFVKNYNNGYIVFNRSESIFIKVFKAKPKVIMAVYKKDGENPISPTFLSKLNFPSAAFFIVQLDENPIILFPSKPSSEITGKCYRLYKPIPNMPLKVFPMMFYRKSNRSTWSWVSPKMNSNYYEKETRNMSGITITTALVSHREKKETLHRFWTGRNSFFWRAMRDHLHYRSLIHFQKITPEAVKSITKIYLTLLMTVADGLGVLPVISSERNLQMGFVVTGIDSKYHLYVKAPEYTHSWQSIFKPLDFGSWICLGIMILLITLVLKIVAFYQNLSEDFISCLLTIFGFICCQSSSSISKNIPTRMVCFTALVFSIFIYQFYTSNFYSILSTKEVSLPFTSIEQFMTKRSHALFVNPDTAIYGELANAKNGTFKKLWDNFLKNEPSHQLKTHMTEKTLRKLCKGKAAILGLPFQTLHLNGQKCKMVPVNSGFFPRTVVTVVRKNFPFMSQFKYVHLKLLEAGLSHKFKDEHLNYENLHEIKPEVTNEPVSLEHVAFLYAFHGAFVILSWLILGLEILAAKTYKKNSKKYGWL